MGRCASGSFVADNLQQVPEVSTGEIVDSTKHTRSDILAKTMA